MIITISIFYFALLFLTAFLSRKNENLEEFIVAGKKLGALVTAASSRATGTSAWLILGYTGFGYAFGIKGIWIAIGEVICVFVSWYTIAPRFKKLTDRLGANTYTEFLEKATNDKTGLVRLISSILICLLIIPYVSAQFLGMGKAFEIFFDIPFSYGIWLGAILTVSYTVIGGYRAISWTDFIQALFMGGGVLFLIVLLLFKIPPVAFQQEISLPVGFWNLFGSDGISWRGIAGAVSFLAIGIGLFGIPHMFVPFLAAKDVNVIRKGAPYALGFTLITEVGALSLGMLAHFLITDLADAEQIMPVLSTVLLSPIWSGILVSVIFACAMSTADSLLMSASTSLVYDLYRNYLKPTPERDRYLVLLSKVCLVVISVLSAFLAQGEYSLIFWLIVFVWSGLTATFVPTCLLLVFERKIENYQVVTSLLVGFLSTVLWKMFFAESTHVGEILVGTLLGFITIPLAERIANLQMVKRYFLEKEYERAV